jgi:hypothetical protein
MWKMLLTLVAAALVLSFSQGAFGLEAPLKYQPLPERIPAFNNPIIGIFSPGLPAGKWKLPSSLNSPQYALLHVADGVHLLVLEQGKTKRFDYRILIDRDGDGDLTNEHPLESKVQKNPGGPSGMGTFGRIELSVLTGGVRKQQMIVLSLMKQAGGISFRYSEQGFYKGILDLNGTPYTISLYDGNGNGRFDDATGDRVIISEDGFGDYWDIQPLGDVMLIGSALFRVKADIASERITFTSVTRGLSMVRLPMPLERLSLLDETSGRFLTIFRPSGDTLLIPPGNYRVLSYQALRSDAKGDRWRLSAQGTQFTPVLKVSLHTAASLVMGEPYITQISCRVNSFFFHTSLSMNIASTEGAGRERIQSLQIIRKNIVANSPVSAKVIRELPDAPAYTIIKSDGEIVARGSFHYG